MGLCQPTEPFQLPIRGSTLLVSCNSRHAIQPPAFVAVLCLPGQQLPNRASMLRIATRTVACLAVSNKSSSRREIGWLRWSAEVTELVAMQACQHLPKRSSILSMCKPPIQRLSQHKTSMQEHQRQRQKCLSSVQHQCIHLKRQNCTQHRPQTHSLRGQRQPPMHQVTLLLHPSCQRHTFLVLRSRRPIDRDRCLTTTQSCGNPLLSG